MKQSLFFFSVLFFISSYTQAADRVALVIGNNAYQQAPLRQARNDAKKVGDALENIGFKVVRSYDANRAAMDTALTTFGQQAQQASIAVVYYAGHAIQVEGKNYLIPANTPVRGRSDLRKLMDLNELVLEAKQAQGLGLVLLDACRNNPFADHMAAALGRSVVGRGLKRIESTPTNVIVGFATKEDAIAPDDSHYARALLKYLPQKNLEVRLLMGSIRDEVMEAAAKQGEQQEPYTYGTLGKKTWFLAGQTAVKPTDNDVAPSSPKPPPVVIQPPAPRVQPRLAIEPEMVAIRGGRFHMGCVSGKDCSDNEKPIHQVSIKAFELAATEVTFAQWDACVKAKGCSHQPDDQGWGRGQRPVINVSWNDANQYVAWLNKKTNKDYRLPTEAEWEYAARADTTTAYAFGNKITTKQANFNNVLKKTTKVAQYPANAWGLHDMHGNVWEWVQDRYQDNYKNSPTDGSAWESTGADRVLRGGSWYYAPRILRSAIRSRNSPDIRLDYNGFRLARSPDK